MFVSDLAVFCAGKGGSLIMPTAILAWIAVPVLLASFKSRHEAVECFKDMQIYVSERIAQWRQASPACSVSTHSLQAGQQEAGTTASITVHTVEEVLDLCMSAEVSNTSTHKASLSKQQQQECMDQQPDVVLISDDPASLQLPTRSICPEVEEVRPDLCTADHQAMSSHVQAAAELLKTTASLTAAVLVPPVTLLPEAASLAPGHLSRSNSADQLTVLSANASAAAVLQDSTSSEDACSDPVLSPLVQAAMQLVDPKVRVALQAMAAVGGHTQAPEVTQPEVQQLHGALVAAVQGTATEAQAALVAAAVTTTSKCAPLLVLFEPAVIKMLLHLQVPQGISNLRAAQDLWLAAHDYLQAGLHEPAASFLHTFRCFSLPSQAAHQVQLQLQQAKLQVECQQASSNTSNLDPCQALTPDQAMLLLCQPGLRKERSRLRDKLAGKVTAPLHGQQTLQLLRAVYDLPAACDGLLQALLCQRCSSEVCSPDDKASRLRLLRQFARQYVEGLESDSFENVATVNLP